MSLYAFDGTWNQKKDGEDPDYTNTNVVRFHAAYAKNSGRPEFYVEGVGTRFQAIGQALGGVFGLGELTRIEEGYKQLCREWIATSGKAPIDIVGFSRGAATALDFCNYLLDRGIRDPDTGAQVAGAPEIRFLEALGRRGGVRPRQPRKRGPELRPSPGPPARKPDAASTRWRSTSVGCRSFQRACRAPAKCGFAACTRISAAATATAA